MCAKQVCGGSCRRHRHAWASLEEDPGEPITKQTSPTGKVLGVLTDCHHVWSCYIPCYTDRLGTDWLSKQSQGQDRAEPTWRKGSGIHTAWLVADQIQVSRGSWFLVLIACLSMWRWYTNRSLTEHMCSEMKGGNSGTGLRSGSREGSTKTMYQNRMSQKYLVLYKPIEIFFKRDNKTSKPKWLAYRLPADILALEQNDLWVILAEVFRIAQAGESLICAPQEGLAQ